ncbi:MAG: class I SAM-dependent methyltransferase, partial [Spirochaetia bacterium]|nr:class I SAM-dependent methyltransferase [Spirochaetia bacterium]
MSSPRRPTGLRSSAGSGPASAGRRSDERTAVRPEHADCDSAILRDICGAIADSGNGTLAAALNEKGWNAVGIELNPAMASKAKSPVIEGSMRDAVEIARRWSSAATDTRPAADAAFLDAVLCLGNTLPHLEPGERAPFFSNIRSLLRPWAPFVIQILNYGRADIGPGFAFPEISAGNVRFSRRYAPGPAPGSLSFLTRLRIECEIYEDTTVLYPISPSTLAALLGRAGFSHIDFYSGWSLQ